MTHQFRKLSRAQTIHHQDIRAVLDSFGSFQSGYYHLFAGDKSTTRPGIARQHTLRRDIAATKIFPQEKSNTRIERTFVKPVHESASLGAQWERGHPVRTARAA